MNLSDYNIGGDAAQSILGVGDSGTGKSIAFASWPKPLYFLSCDGRIAAVSEWFRGSEDAKGMTFDEFSSYESLDDRIEELISSCPYKTIVVDPLTSISSYLMRYSFGLRGALEYNEATGQVERYSKGKKRGKVDLTSYDDIALEHRGIEDILLNLKIIRKTHNCNTILTAHLLTTTYKKVGGSDSNIVKDIVTAGRKIVPFIPTMFDEYYHFYTENEQWMIKTYNDGIVPARTSFLLMPKIINWTNKNLYSEMSKYYVKSEKSEKKEGE